MFDCRSRRSIGHIQDIDNRLEGKGFMRGQARQYFAVELNIRLAQMINESTIRPRILSGSGVDLLNPQFAQIALLGLAIPVGVLPGFLEFENGNPKTIFGTAPKAFGAAEDVFVLKKNHNRKMCV